MERRYIPLLVSLNPKRFAVAVGKASFPDFAKDRYMAHSIERQVAYGKEAGRATVQARNIRDHNLSAAK
jgi:hypothetical protein